MVVKKRVEEGVERKICERNRGRNTVFRSNKSMKMSLIRD
jgi:hypothetical protein